MRERIEVHPGVHFGKPCVAGTRIPVIDVLELIERGISFDEIRRDFFPALADEDIRACVRYAVDVLRGEDLRVSTGS